MSHTPEPWKYENIEGKNREGFASHLHRIAQEQTNTMVVSMEQKSICDVPDAIRIVAAINGCAGLNPAAYRQVVEALRALVSAFEYSGSDLPEFQAAEDALAAAQGQSI